MWGKEVSKKIKKVVRVMQVVEQHMMCTAENCNGEIVPCLNKSSPGNIAHACNKCKVPILFEFGVKFPYTKEIILTESEF